MTSTGKLQLFFKVKCQIYHSIYVFSNHLKYVKLWYHFYFLVCLLLSFWAMCLSPISHEPCGCYGVSLGRQQWYAEPPTPWCNRTERKPTAPSSTWMKLDVESEKESRGAGDMGLKGLNGFWLLRNWSVRVQDWRAAHLDPMCTRIWFILLLFFLHVTAINQIIFLKTIYSVISLSSKTGEIYQLSFHGT